MIEMGFSSLTENCRKRAVHPSYRHYPMASNLMVVNSVKLISNETFWTAVDVRKSTREVMNGIQDLIRLFLFQLYPHAQRIQLYARRFQSIQLRGNIVTNFNMCCLSIIP